jgi:hypothetical protein
VKLDESFDQIVGREWGTHKTNLSTKDVTGDALEKITHSNEIHSSPQRILFSNFRRTFAVQQAVSASLEKGTFNSVNLPRFLTGELRNARRFLPLCFLNAGILFSAGT